MSFPRDITPTTQNGKMSIIPNVIQGECCSKDNVHHAVNIETSESGIDVNKDIQADPLEDAFILR